MSWKRPLFLFHRWAGIVLCLFFALWFISGVFMMYVEFPQLTRMEALAGMQPLDFSDATLSPGAALEKVRQGDFDVIATPRSLRRVQVADPAAPAQARSIRLRMILDRPAYLISPDGAAQPRVVFADSGEVLREITPAVGKSVTLKFLQRSGANIKADRVVHDGSIVTDQWTVSSALNDHRPLLRYTVLDAAGTQLYVSSRTAEVVRDTHRTERIFNYFGAVTHWLYPTFIRKYPLAWEWLVDLLSAAGVLLGASGLWIGVLRWKRRPQPGKPSVPYRGLMRWHYFTGITFGLFAVTWVLSGLLSMNPLDLNPPRRPRPDEALLFAGRTLSPTDFALPSAGFAGDDLEADLIHFDGRPFYRAIRADGTMHLIAGDTQVVRLPDKELLTQRAALLLPTANVTEMRWLTAYDDYYYSRHPERGEKPLPILRVKFDDEQHTWFHIDPIAGQVTERMTRANRIYRWLYNGLHSWDIRWLWERRPLWDICVIGFSIGGTVLSVLGVVVGIRRLRGSPNGHLARTARAA